ncbi:EPIDERMAL PATTERNING FACTOR-like protein 2 [Prunus dulcis]|uniref:EPIDERMAL PATTERNING FACTOR-like protein 2 n=1 Tax=Prunus dulcis TaxID=3755 RepID=A0A4Y1QTS8_PRUDU|nr:EPIDERMAL PATTERNING FACTOR-like protein 2 [Prunus dulcis]
MGARLISSKLTKAAPLNMKSANSIPEEVMFLRKMKLGGGQRTSNRIKTTKVPVSPQVQGHSKIRSHGSLPDSTRTSPKNVAYSRGDDITNYKPISWKCKCGDLLFNP